MGGVSGVNTSFSMDPNTGSVLMGATNPFHQQQPAFNGPAFAPISGAGSNPAPNPFSQSYNPPGITGAANPFAGLGGNSLQQQSSFQSQMQPFSQTPAAQQFQASLQSHPQPQTFFQPQPQPPAQQQGIQPFGQQPSPFGQPSPYGQQQPSPFGQQPSPFGHQSSPQTQLQQQQALSPGNPFNNWHQQGGGYQSQGGGQQWSGM
jgi:hypothetical protein